MYKLKSLLRHRCGCWEQYRPGLYHMARYTQDTTTETRFNEVNIQMLSPRLHSQIFKGKEAEVIDQRTLSSVEKHLRVHGLWGKSAKKLKNVDLDLSIKGNNIEEHFENIAKDEYLKYFNLAAIMSSLLPKSPPIPNKWKFQSGWTKYNTDGSSVSVEVPDEDVLVFDVEVCLSAGNFPILATALSPTAWYGWVSEQLFLPDFAPAERITANMLIPIENIPHREKLLIGHHVAYDRSKVKDQYSLKESRTRFLDTLSLHMCVSGLTNAQRFYMNSKNQPQLYKWMEVGTTNSLAKVYKFYCGKDLAKDTRDLFVNGTIDDIRGNFQDCMTYCAKDVASTREVFQVIWPEFIDHAPHPVTFGGMLEMGTSYLPINHSWASYNHKCEQMYNELTWKKKETLMALADEALKKIIGHAYEEDPWLCHLDWSIHKTVTNCETQDELWEDENDIHGYIRYKVRYLPESRRKQLNMPGYPKWYRDLCMSPTDPDYKPGPQNISSQTKVTPYLLQMTWNGYPLHHVKGSGWGYLVPKNSRIEVEPRPVAVDFNDWLHLDNDNNSGSEMKVEHYNNSIFYRLPHKNGVDNNVGNPLAKDFLGKIDDGTLASGGSFNAKKTIEMNKMLSYWRGTRKRIMSQHTVWMDGNEENGSEEQGVILPQVITAGTVTRRAVEPTWLTVSNPKRDRIGSEIKSMVHAPPGYCLVGADVDSQELWIAAVLGDAQFSGIHGSTAFGWMTLQGNKGEGTDLHSKTADTIGADRDIAKIFNYGRIYGAGERFAVRLLKQHNPNLTDNEAQETAKKLYTVTKGVKMHKLTANGMMIAKDMGLMVDNGELLSYNQLKKILNKTGTDWNSRTDIVEEHKIWNNGSESEMFNRLESIAISNKPTTPVLGCKITNALLPKYVDNDFMTSRVNWAVQSSAVDYLHLLLTCMRWLIKEYKIDARFCISVHDEVRYLVSERDKYKAALALQVSNLLTRSLFAYKLGMYDLPQSVAFFSSVDIDKVWRKEVDLECVTPSNPDGMLLGHDVKPGESVDIYNLLEKLGELSYGNV